MGRWAQRQRYGRPAALALPPLVVAGVDLQQGATGSVTIFWGTDLIPDDTSFSLQKVSDSSVVGLHADHLPGVNNGSWNFPGLTSGLLVKCICTFSKSGWAPTTLLSNFVTVP